MTPNDLEILIHCYVSPSVHERINAPAVQETIVQFLADGVIEQRGENIYSTTEKGAAWINEILNTPIPRLAYLNASGKEIIIEDK